MERSEITTLGLYALGFGLLMPELLGAMGLFDSGCNVICGAERLGGWFDKIESGLLIPTFAAMFPLSIANYRAKAPSGLYHAVMDFTGFMAVILASSDITIAINGSVFFEQLEGPLSVVGLVCVLVDIIFLWNAMFLIGDGKRRRTS